MKILEFMATLGLDTSEFETKMKGAKETGEKAFSGVTTKSGAGTIVLGNLLTDVARKTTATIENIAKAGISYNASMELYEAKFTAMLGSADEAKAKIQELKELDMVSPYSFDQLAGATNNLLRYGVSAEKTMDVLKMLGDISLGDAQSLDSLAYAYAQVSAAGKLYGQEKRQLINAGFNPLQELSKMSGVSLGDLEKIMEGENASDSFSEQLQKAREEVEKLGDSASESAQIIVRLGEDGAVSADLVNLAFKNATDEGGRFYNAMETANKTFTGQMGNLTAQLNQLAGQVFQPAFEWLSENALPFAIDATKQLALGFEQGGLSGMLEAAGNIVKGLGNSLIEKAEELLPNFLNDIIGTINDFFGINIPEIKEIDLPTIDEAVAAIKGWWEDVKVQLGTLFFPVSPTNVYTGESGVQHAGGSGDRFATGLDYVPYNEFPARLHEGEAVLTKLEASNWREGRLRSSSEGGETVSVVVNLDNVSIRDERDIETLAQQIAQYTRRQNYGMGAVSY